jgi:hypothetical protein
MRGHSNLVLIVSAALLVMIGRMNGQVSYEPLAPPAPQSYSECDRFKSDNDRYEQQQRKQASDCDHAYVSGCGMSSSCLAQNGCHNCWPQHTQCGDIFYQGRNCGVYAQQAACTHQRGNSLYKQCYAEVQAFLERQRAQESARQQAAAQQAAVQQSISDAASTAASLLTGTNRTNAGPSAANGNAGSSDASSSTSADSSLPDAAAYARAASPDFRGIAEEWVKQKVSGSEHIFDAWQMVESAKAFSELQSSVPTDQVKGIGETANALLNLHWGVYSPNQLSAEVSQRSIDVVTDLAGQAFGTLDEGMSSALAATSPQRTSGNAWDFNRAQEPISIPYVAETPAGVVALPSSATLETDQDADIMQFLKTLEAQK